MAPEQVRGEEVDVRTDIWGAGAVLYEMATGRRPFPMENWLQLIEAIKYLDPQPPSALNKHITPELDALIMKALDKDRERRYQSVRELGVDLLRLQPSSSASGRLSSEVFGPARKKSAWVTWAAFALLALACVVAGYLVREKWGGGRAGGHHLLTVLPFDSAGQDEKTSALISGLTETVTTKLAQTWGQNLQLISAREVREQGVKTIEQAWKDFGSDLVLEGSAHRVGDKIRINCALVDPRTHRELGANTIDADTADVFGLEDQVASKIVSLLSESGDIRGPAAAVVRTENSPEAYASYLRARGYLREYQKAENIDLAIAELKHAVTVDPSYASAYAVLGEAYLLGYEQVNRGGDWVKQAQQNCEKSLAVRETAEGHVCLGGVYNKTGKYDLAVPELQKAVQLDASNEDGLRGLADAYMKLGNAVGAEATYKKAIELRPNYWGVYSWLGFFYYTQSRYGDAAAQFEKVVALAPNNPRGYSNLGGMYAAQGKYDQSVAEYKKSIDIQPTLEAFNNLGYTYFQMRHFSDAADAFQHGLNLDDSDWQLWGNLGDSLYWSGTRRAKAAEAYENAISRADKKLEVNAKDASTLAYVADYNAMAGHREKALDQIERAMALAPAEGEVRFRAAVVFNRLTDTQRCLSALERAVAVGYSAQVIRDTVDFDHLHGNARFKKLTQIK